MSELERQENVIDENTSKGGHDISLKRVCKFFMEGRKCTKSDCRFIHDELLCENYWKHGACTVDGCTRNHFVTKPIAIPAPKEGNAQNGSKKQQNVKNKPASQNQNTEEDKGMTYKPVRKEKHSPKKVSTSNEEQLSNPPNSSTVSLEEATESSANQAKQGTKRGEKSKQKKKFTSRQKNTLTFEPLSTPVDIRIVYDLGHGKDGALTTPLTTRDALLAPNVFSDFPSQDLYARLVDEIKKCTVPEKDLLVLWHGNDKIEGTHLIANDRTRWKKECPTFDLVISRLRTFFKMDIQATRFNWYTDTSQWKPFHHDSAYVNPERAALQNFTVAVSFGATRDAAFEHATTKTVVSIPQPDGSVYAFCSDTNGIWRHGILQDTPTRNEGRISVIAWGKVENMGRVAHDVEAPQETKPVEP